MVLISQLSRWPRIITGDHVPGAPAETTNIFRARALRAIQLGPRTKEGNIIYQELFVYRNHTEPFKFNVDLSDSF